MAMESDYAMLWDNKLGQKMFDGGFVHNGLLKSAAWLIDNEGDTIKELIEEYPNYTLTFTGHSLGSGIAALLALIVVNNRDLLGEIPRNQIRCFAFAPARCMSLNLAVRYADIVNSVVLQVWFNFFFYLHCCLVSNYNHNYAFSASDNLEDGFWMQVLGFEP